MILLVICLTFAMPFSVNAKTVNRYLTKTVALKEESNTKSKTICKVNRNKKVTLVSQNKTWSKIQYKNKVGYVQKSLLNKNKAKNVYPGKKFKNKGRVRWNKCSWTWYSQRILPGRGLKIPGRHVDKRGFVCDKDDYICLASGKSNKKKHAIVPTPFGKFGKVYDTNGRNNNKWFDTYVNW